MLIFRKIFCLLFTYMGNLVFKLLWAPEHLSDPLDPEGPNITSPMMHLLLLLTWLSSLAPSLLLFRFRCVK